MGRCVCLDDWAEMENYSVLYWLCTYLGLQWLRCIGYIGTYITLHWLGNLWHMIRIHTKQIRIHREIHTKQQRWIIGHESAATMYGRR